MKSAIVLIFLLSTFTRLCAQTPGDLLRDVQANATSVTALRGVIEKHKANKDATTRWAYYNDSIGFFQQKKLFQSFIFRDPSTKKDSPGKTMNLFVTYTGDQVRYIKFEGFHYESSGGLAGLSRPVYYIDTVYTDSLLSTYNAIHKTNFTPTDLYEDECDLFCLMARKPLVSTYKKADGTGQESVTYAYEFGEFWPTVRDRDHAAIGKNCRSFNTNRKAFGAFCLYVLQQKGEPLSREEQELMQKILNSAEKINYRSASKRSDGVQIKDLLTPQELKYMYSYLYRGK